MVLGAVEFVGRRNTAKTVRGVDVADTRSPVTSFNICRNGLYTHYYHYYYDYTVKLIPDSRLLYICANFMIDFWISIQPCK